MKDSTPSASCQWARGAKTAKTDSMICRTVFSWNTLQSNRLVICHDHGTTLAR
ncbi:MAG: hypothetical protein JWL63_855 [Rhodocyclales bacterium]|nr:hypothetical protein [Rhodocyclales bacterium]